MKVRILSPAQGEIFSTVHHYDEQADGLGLEFVEELEAVWALLEEHPVPKAILSVMFGLVFRCSYGRRGLPEMAGSKKSTEIGSLLIQGTHEALEHKRGERVDVAITRAKVTARKVDVVPPPEYRDIDIRRVRERLGLSQSVFARLIGASASTVRAWERGAREPSEMARRLIELAEREPQVFEDDLMLAES